ncbi:response regulator transcription factor [Pseudactinotalea sp. Z1732]|uniref:response regulator transcription factor n=1 Tax=Micrococcales TaxID=85006 RepID=UPI003C7B5AFD
MDTAPSRLEPEAAAGAHQRRLIRTAHQGRQGLAAGRQSTGPAGRLSVRELEVLRLVAEGRANREIAGDLFLSTHTIKRHVAHILDKLNAGNRTEAVARGRDLGLLD